VSLRAVPHIPNDCDIFVSDENAVQDLAILTRLHAAEDKEAKILSHIRNYSSDNRA